MDRGFSFAPVANPQVLLREPGLRKQLFVCAAAGKRYTAELLKCARKPVVAAAVEIAATRLERRAAAAVRRPDLRTRLAIFKCEKRRKLKVAHAEDERLFHETIKGVFRTATAGTHFLKIDIEPLVSEIGAAGMSSRGDCYSSRCTYRRTNSCHRYRITPNWKETVRNRGIAVLDGLVTLWAELESEQDGMATYAAVWVGQGRGFSLESSRGWVACYNGTNFHSTKSAAAARSGLRRKLAWQYIPADQKAARVSSAVAARARQRLEQTARLTERLERLDLGEIGHVEVTYEDSRKAGNCHDGTVAFAERLFGDGRRRATIGEIVETLSGRGDQLARFLSTELGRQFMAACLQAIRRQRQTQRSQKTSSEALACGKVQGLSETILGFTPKNSPF